MKKSGAVFFFEKFNFFSDLVYLLRTKPFDITLKMVTEGTTPPITSSRCQIGQDEVVAQNIFPAADHQSLVVAMSAKFSEHRLLCLCECLCRLYKLSWVVQIIYHHFLLLRLVSDKADSPSYTTAVSNHSHNPFIAGRVSRMRVMICCRLE